MAKESGVNVLLQVSDGAASPTNFITVAGQQSTEFVGDTETDDITDKSHSGWGSTLNVLRRGTVNCQGKADWPDTTGLPGGIPSWSTSPAARRTCRATRTRPSPPSGGRP